MWVADGIDPALVADLLDASMHSLVRDFETRCRMIIGAVTFIQKGANPRLTEHLLLAFTKHPKLRAFYKHPKSPRD